MSAADGNLPFDAAELRQLFAAFLDHTGIVLAVSGGPDSTALMLLARAWRYGLLDGPSFLVATVDHGLRPESRAEALKVAALCANLGLRHEILTWDGEKPRSRIQEAARIARYRLLTQLARERGATAIALAHTMDDQAETVLLRLARGSGLTGLCAMRPISRTGELTLLRPFLDTPKSRLVAVVEGAGIDYVRDPSNADPRFARPRLRNLAPGLAQVGLDAARLALFAQRLSRAEAALNAVAEDARRSVSEGPWTEDEVNLKVAPFLELPEEISLRLLIQAIDQCATEGPTELGKAEDLHQALRSAGTGGMALRRTLAGALVTLRKGRIAITPAPPRGEGGQRRARSVAANSPGD
ncbi:tRNA lysidine(34) synthetase TilS [Aquabacter sediminis]|uniref:tRNA lysidine(34) synthetase TilS n=1 Tax=Aquabacter sediminis TaxID=3029197 RepID=UPI00237DEF3B|nr:tRNA lysidine(34) synthetase TilS [Aquabacter sp. P-9]MDE1570884.1 tRNA lysidine(34) synthetase TilS [Aquabacter sp. P-9]